MKLFKLSPKLARTLYARLIKIAPHFVDLDAESDFLDSRVLEYSFVISKIIAGQKKGKVLDVGCTDCGNLIPLCLASLGWEVYGIDNREWKFSHPKFHFTLGDIRERCFPENHFDYVYAASSLEHIGLEGRYGIVEKDTEGDMQAVMEIARILHPDGTFLTTMPFGKGRLIKPLQRIYDEARIKKLFSGWQIKEELFYILSEGFYVPASKEAAGRMDYLKDEQSLALFALTPLK